MIHVNRNNKTIFEMQIEIVIDTFSVDVALNFK